MATDEDSERKAIQEINQRDTEAILSGDLAMITSQWTEDFTVIPESGSIVRGRSANVQIAEPSQSADPIDGTH